MYAAQFGLSQPPFSIAPDPRFLYMSERHREALAHLLYGIQGGGGFVLLTGAVGAGKTTVARCFVEQLPPHCRLAYVFNPQLTARELLRTICDEFGVVVPEGGSVQAHIEPLNRFLLEGHAAGRHAVLIIDEAQTLPAELLEQLRLLTNLETDTRKLLQIILIGQPELRERLAAPDMTQLAQRVIARYHLEALGEAETAQYVRHRLAIAGLTGPLPFSDRALRQVFRLSRGVPRRINLLCDRALLGAYAQGRHAVDSAVVAQAAREAFDEPAPRRAASAGTSPRWGLPQVLMAAVAVGALSGAGVGALVGAWRAGADDPERARLGSAAGPTPGPTAVAAPGAAAPTAAPTATPPTAAGTPSVDAPGASAGNAGPTGPAAGPLRAPELDAAGLYARAGWPDDRAAWRALAGRWSLAADLPSAGDPCAMLSDRGLVCHRGAATLALIRQIDRPGWLPLQTAAGPAVPVLLTALDERQATLLLPEGPVTVSLATLASRWSGDFSTLWQRPPGADGAARTAWIEARLQQAQAGVLPAETPLRTRIQAFQRAQGLPADGLAGPLTLMQLNRVAAVAEPRLSAER